MKKLICWVHLSQPQIIFSIEKSGWENKVLLLIKAFETYKYRPSIKHRTKEVRHERNHAMNNENNGFSFPFNDQ